MNPIFYSKAIAVDAVCRIACLVVLLCTLLISEGVRALDWVPDGYAWFGYKILFSLISILPILRLAKQAIIVDMIDIAMYEVGFFIMLAIAATGPAKSYVFFSEAIAPVFQTFLFYVTVLRLLWIPVVKNQVANIDWPAFGLFGYISWKRGARVVPKQRIVIVWLVLAALLVASYLVGRLRDGWPYLMVGSAGLFLVARYWPVFVDLLGNTIDDRARLADSMQAAANELALLKQALAEQAAAHAATMDEASAQLMLDEVVTPAGRDMLRQISQIHPGIRKELILYIMDVCQAARLEKLRLVRLPS